MSEVLCDEPLVFLVIVVLIIDPLSGAVEVNTHSLHTVTVQEVLPHLSLSQQAQAWTDLVLLSIFVHVQQAEVQVVDVVGAHDCHAIQASVGNFGDRRHDC